MIHLRNSSTRRSVFFKKGIRNKIAVLLLVIIFIFSCDYFGLFLHFLEADYSTFSYPLDIPMQDVLSAIRKHEKLPYKPVNDYNFHYKIENKDKCILLNGDYEKVVILYVIKSALLNHERRNAIRKSWGWENRFSDVLIRRIFMVGESEDPLVQLKLYEEYAKNKDLVQAEFIDNYYNNTVKMMASFKWVVKHCPKAQFIMFADDDMYISTKNLLKFIRNPFNQNIGFRKRRDINIFNGEDQINQDSKEMFFNQTYQSRKVMDFDPNLSAFDGRLYAGYVFSSSPMRHKSSKWYITLSEYPFSQYPPYVTAGAFVLSFPALEDMHYTSLYTNQFKFDDVYLGIIAKKCGISPLHNENFHFWKKTYNGEGYSSVIASHGYGDPVELKSVWDEQRSLGYA